MSYTTAYSAVVKITLKAECEVTPAQVITVGEVAKVEASKEVAKKVSAVTIGTAPLPGSKRNIDSSYVRLRVDAAKVGAEVKIQGPSEITVLGKCSKLSSNDLAEEAKTFILNQLPQDNRTYEVTVQRVPREVVTAADTDVQIKPRLMSNTARLGINNVALDIVTNGKVTSTTSAVLQVKAVAEVLVVTRTIRSGETLTSENTAWQQKDITKSPDSLAMEQGGELHGWLARRTLNKGSIISSGDVQLPAAIKKGETVILSVKCGRVKLTTSAEARQDGRVGDTIQVRSSVSNDDVRAKIVEPGLVEIIR